MIRKSDFNSTDLEKTKKRRKKEAGYENFGFEDLNVFAAIMVSQNQKLFLSLEILIVWGLGLYMAMA